MTETNTCLSIENLSKGYQGPDGQWQEVLSIDQFQMKAGEQLALGGPSGAGKSTLLNCIAGIASIDKGDIHINGKSLGNLDEAGKDRFRAKNIGYIFQNFNLLPALTALENVCLPMMIAGKPDPKRAQALLVETGLEKRMNYLPGKLSVGERQRVAVARALANLPPLILADEPTASLDPDQAARICQMIQSACHQHHAALLWVTHAPTMAARFPKTIDISTFLPHTDMPHSQTAGVKTP